MSFDRKFLVPKFWEMWIVKFFEVIFLSPWLFLLNPKETVPLRTGGDMRHTLVNAVIFNTYNSIIVIYSNKSLRLNSFKQTAQDSCSLYPVIQNVFSKLFLKKRWKITSSLNRKYAVIGFKTLMQKILRGNKGKLKIIQYVLSLEHL